MESDEAPPALADVVDEPVPASVEFALAVPVEPVLSPETLLVCAPPADSAALPEVAVALLEELSVVPADPLFIVLVLELVFDAVPDPKSSEEHPPSTNSAAAESPSGTANARLIPTLLRFGNSPPRWLPARAADPIHSSAKLLRLGPYPARAARRRVFQLSPKLLAICMQYACDLHVIAPRRIDSRSGIFHWACPAGV